MTSILPRLLAGIILSAAVTGAAAAYQTAAQPIDGAQLATWDDLRAARPQEKPAKSPPRRGQARNRHAVLDGGAPGLDACA